MYSSFSCWNLQFKYEHYAPEQLHNCCCKCYIFCCHYTAHCAIIL
ncbi:hypothetical protein BACCAP_01146 [Pseudoflavonifractor capillosus ATCC 29799]|uniref:Uncharacterized protein n=1 Tax=Pseudoflavonifractor capillosus ATCC 29799 TaxID=411467 RepID=A6NSG7_9FIRM|nr:hypothetical protein BACCAP_01146 [Pseudoflavonifractor capillosus ATCC 29799]